MSILGRAIANAMASRAGVIKDEKKSLIGETVKLGLPAPSVSVHKIDKGPKKLRMNQVVPSGALRANIPVEAGVIQVTSPFTDKEALATYFRMDFAFGAPASVIFTRGFLGGSWEAHESQAELPEVKRFIERLEEIDTRLTDDIELRQELVGAHIDLAWGMQIFPTGPSSCTAIIQTGRIGIFSTSHGVEVAQKSFQALRDLLAGYSGQYAQALPPHAHCLAMEEIPLDPEFSGQSTEGVGTPPPATPAAPAASPEPVHRPRKQEPTFDAASYVIYPKEGADSAPAPSAAPSPAPGPAPRPQPKAESPAPAPAESSGGSVIKWVAILVGGFFVLSCAGCMGLGVLGTILENAGY